MPRAVIMITDSGMLMGEVFHSSRRPDGTPGGKITSLLWAIHQGGAALILPRHILDEVERDLPRRAKPTDDLDLAYRRLRGLYLARARIVDVPTDWALGDSRVQAVAQRHPVDLPAAQLAVTIGGCFLLTEDPDLSDPPGLGISAWLQVAHAAASEVEYTSVELTARIPLNIAGETIGAVSRRMAAASPGGKLTLGIVAAGVVVGAIWLVKSGKADKFFERAWPVVQELGGAYGPPLMETVQRHMNGQVVFQHAVVPRAEAQTLGERIARVLAYSSEPLLAVNIARKLETPGNLRDRTHMVRAELQGYPAFTEVTRGRWELGTPSGYTREPLPLAEVWDYRARLHKNAKRAWEGARSPSFSPAADQ
jgi:hypothetical protein